MKVFITRNKGYIGAVMAPVLIAAGHEVVGWTPTCTGECTFDDPPLPVPTIGKDVRDVNASDVAGFDAIVHLFALSNNPLDNLDRELTLSINFHGSVHLAQIAKQADVPRLSLLVLVQPVWSGRR